MECHSDSLCDLELNHALDLKRFRLDAGNLGEVWLYIHSFELLYRIGKVENCKPVIQIEFCEYNGKKLEWKLVYTNYESFTINEFSNTVPFSSPFSLCFKHWNVQGNISIWAVSGLFWMLVRAGRVCASVQQLLVKPFCLYWHCWLPLLCGTILYRHVSSKLQVQKYRKKSLS